MWLETLSKFQNSQHLLISNKNHSNQHICTTKSNENCVCSNSNKNSRKEIQFQSRLVPGHIWSYEWASIIVLGLGLNQFHFRWYSARSMERRDFECLNDNEMKSNASRFESYWNLNYMLLVLANEKIFFYIKNILIFYSIYFLYNYCIN